MGGLGLGGLSKGTADAAYARLKGPLGGFKRKLATDPSNAKVVFAGPSTMAPELNASVIPRRIYGLHTQQGEALYGLGSTDVFTDGVANGTTTFTSATAAFTTADVGRLLHGDGTQAGTVISQYNGPTSVTLNKTVPTGTGLKFWVGRHVVMQGNNGLTLSEYMGSPGSSSWLYNRNKLAAENADLIVSSWLINDVRQGELGDTVAAIVANGMPLLQSWIEWVRANQPQADHLLVIPNSFLTQNVLTNNYVKDSAGNVNPTGLAQIQSEGLRRIYQSFIGAYSNVAVCDAQAEVFGTRSLGSSAKMTDQIHPSGNQSGDSKFRTPVGGGYVGIADAIARQAGFPRNALPLDATRVAQEFIVENAPANGQVRLISRDYNNPAGYAALSRSDSLYVNGIDSPIALTSATFDRLTGSPNWLTITGLGTTDFSSVIGQTAAIVGAHGPAITERTTVFVDLPSIAAGAVIKQAVTVAGVATGNQGHAVGVIAIPPAGFATDANALYFHGAYVTGTDTVALEIENRSAGAIDRGGENWTFILVH